MEKLQLMRENYVNFKTVHLSLYAQPYTKIRRQTKKILNKAVVDVDGWYVLLSGDGILALVDIVYWMLCFSDRYTADDDQDYWLFLFPIYWITFTFYAQREFNGKTAAPFRVHTTTDFSAQPKWTEKKYNFFWCFFFYLLLLFIFGVILVCKSTCVLAALMGNWW